jgi:hypothetical protein
MQGFEQLPIYAPRSNMYFEREEIRLLIGALVLLFPQYGSIRATREGMQLEVWNFYDRCLPEFIEHLKSGTDAQIGPWIKGQAHQSGEAFGPGKGGHGLIRQTAARKNRFRFSSSR